MTVFTEFMRVRPMIIANIGPTLVAAIVGFVAAVTLSLSFGAIIGLNDRARRTLLPILVGGNAVPRVALAPAIIFYVGGGMYAKYVIAAWIAFFPMLLNTVEGFSEENEDRENLLKILQATPWQRIKYVQTQQALPHIFDGMKLAASLAIIGAIVGEYILADQGLGALTIWALFDYNIGLALAIVGVMGVIATVIVFGLYLLQDRIVFWENAVLFGGE